MNMERALETQRLKLLRLLAGLVVVLRFVSVAPAVSMLPQWVRSRVASLLARIESAANSLVIVAACQILRAQGVRSLNGVSFPYSQGSASPVDGPSNEALLRRIKRLKALLEDLPRHARRMIARMMKSTTDPEEPSEVREIRVAIFATVDTPIASRIERPPDKGWPVDATVMDFAPS